MSLSVFEGKRVLVTGHTGFKGTWLSAWLVELGAKVTGISLPEPVSQPSLFESVGGALDLTDLRFDIRDRERFSSALEEADPEFVFHLAAQPLVRRSYSDPLDTWSSNVIGTANVLDVLRTQQDRPRVAVMVTTDKCYLNREWVYSYREEDPMGGHDPYSASKAACEILISSFIESYSLRNETLGVASVRAGNVIGGGDWAEDRIVPDCIRSMAKDVPVEVRNRHATRPWQHVLDPLGGYLTLASEIRKAQAEKDADRLNAICSPFNFGPELKSNRAVAELVELIAASMGGKWQDATPENAPHEASKLNLAIDKAFHLLEWSPQWDFEKAVERTVDCYRDLAQRTDDRSRLERILDDIRRFSS